MKIINEYTLTYETINDQSNQRYHTLVTYKIR